MNTSHVLPFESTMMNEEEFTKSLQRVATMILTTSLAPSFVMRFPLLTFLKLWQMNLRMEVMSMTNFLSLLAFAPAVCGTRQESRSLVKYAQSTKKVAIGGVNSLSWEDLQCRPLMV